MMVMEDEFGAIRPYQDSEVPTVLARLARDPELQRVAASFLLPRTARLMPWLARWLIGRRLDRFSRRFRSVADLQDFLAGHMRRLIGQTTLGVSVSGLSRLNPGVPYLFISNHRDILMDTGLINYTILDAGHATSRIAVGDNLLEVAYAADLMRLNKSFVIERSARSAKAAYRAHRRSSAFIRASLEAGESVWIAQREGRAKDGMDRTDPTLIKMLGLAWRQDGVDLDGMCQAVNLLPVAITYEVDPGAPTKAMELCVIERSGRYDKPERADLMAIVEGMMGFKGRVHLHFGSPMRGSFGSPEALARALDREIVGGFKVFPTHVEAARRLGVEPLPPAAPPQPRVSACFAEQINQSPPAHLPYLLQQYANLVRSKAEVQA